MNKKMAFIVALGCAYAGATSTVSVTWKTSALGNVFNSLYAYGENISNITEVEKQAIKDAIPDSVHSYLVDVSQIALDFIEGGESGLKSASEYILEPAKLNIEISNYDNYSIQVCDPISSILNNCSSSCTMSGIAPGTWFVYLLSGGKIVECKPVKFTSGNTSSVYFGNVTDKIVVHVYGYTHIYAYESASNIYTEKWPGDAMEADAVDGWNVYTLDEVSSNVIFSNNGTGQSSQGELITAGEYWYKDKTWYTEDPTDYEKPQITKIAASQNSPVKGIVQINITASDNIALNSAFVYINGSTLEKETLLKTVKFSELQKTVSYEWDSRLFKNSDYTLRFVVSDKSNNLSDSVSMDFSTKNENLPPVAVISGSEKSGFGKTQVYKATKSYDPNGKITGYNWGVSGGAELVSGQGSSLVTVKFPGSACNCSVSLTVTDDDGVTASTIKNVTVQENTSFDFREETIYFAMTTRFYDGDPDNNVHCWDENEQTPANDPAWRGDFKGLIEKLDYIKALGFSAVWITPVVENCSGLDYHGYHAMNFSKVDPRYESSDVDFQTLIDEVHSRDMKLVLDVVFNHTGNFGEATLCPMFEKDYSANLEDINDCLKLCENSLLDESYFKLDGDSQYATRLKLMKNTDWKNHETHNYYHHFGFGSWDDFSVQFFQMAGDCVDLNTSSCWDR